MTTFLGGVAIITAVLLVMVNALRVRSPQMSDFELERRERDGQPEAALERRRSRHIADLLSLQRVVSAILLVMCVVASVSAWGWFTGIVFSVVLALEYGAIARLPVFSRLAQPAYQSVEPKLVEAMERYPKVFTLLRNALPVPVEAKISSHEELLHLVQTAGTVLSADEKALIVSGMTFNTRRVSDVMTPRSVIDSVKRSEILGPLVLDDLHKTGHSRFPVIHGDIDHVVGILHVRDLLTLDTARKHTAKVETAMEPKVFYIHEDQTLGHALSAFLKTHHHLFIVVNQYRETVGLLTLEDVMEVLLGRKIVDEFDAHDDLRLVAARNPRENNRPKNAADV